MYSPLQILRLCVDVVAGRNISEINAHITALKKKPEKELTSEDAVLLNNQNDFLRTEIMKRNETISDLSKRANAAFVTVVVYNPDKLQYIADGLARAKIPFVAENNTLYIPDYALETARAISLHYKPSENATSIREQIKMDTDRLVYSSASVEDFPYSRTSGRNAHHQGMHQGSQRSE